MTDNELGEKVLKSFYDNSRRLFPFGAVYTYDEMKKTLTSRLGGKGFIEGLGLAVRLAEFDDSKIENSMEALAQSSGGKIPSSNRNFYDFMIDESTKINFVDAFQYTTTESVKDIVSGAEVIGNSLIDSGKLLTYVLPFAVLFFGYLYLKKKVT
jgi:hypothetical protein